MSSVTVTASEGEQHQGLPVELWRVVFSYLSVNELCRCSQVCRGWRSLVSSLDVTTWRNHFLANPDWKDPQWPCFHSNRKQKPWQQLYREHDESSRLWSRAAQLASASSPHCLLPMLGGGGKRKARKTLVVGDTRYPTLKSALAQAADYDRILIKPGVYDEQFEMSSKIPFELVGAGPAGSVTLIMALEHNALTGRLCNVTLRAPWFTSHCIKVVSGHLQVEKCRLEEGQVVVHYPGSVHFRYSTFSQCQVSFDHVPVSLVENCEFTGSSSSDSTAAVTLTGDPRPAYSWVSPHLLALCNDYQGPEEDSEEVEEVDEEESEEVDSIGVASIACSSTQDEDESDAGIMLSSSSSEEDSGEEGEEGEERDEEGGQQQQHYHHQVSNHSRKVSAREVEQLALDSSSSSSSSCNSSLSSVTVLGGGGTGAREGGRAGRRLSSLWSSDSDSVLEAGLETSFAQCLLSDPSLAEQRLRVQGPVIRQCSFSKGHGGVMVSQQGQGRIERCTFKDLHYGIRCLQNAKVSITENDIHHCATSGIFLRLAAHGLIAGNDIYFTSQAAIDIRKNANPLVQCNRIHHSKRSGIVVLGSGCGILKGNDIYQNREAGIYILYKGNPYVSGNRICHGAATGIAVNEDGRGYIVDNFISGNRWGGIDIRHGSNPHVVRNTICNGLADGIVIGHRGHGTIEGNNVKGNEGCGVWVMGGQPLIQLNQIYNNNDTGVSFLASKTSPDTADDDTAELPDEDEESLSDLDLLNGDACDITEISADRTQQSPRQPQLLYNTIFHNNGYGVVAAVGEAVTLHGNAVHDNRGTGVYIRRCPTAMLSCNSITHNHGAGVLLTASAAKVRVEGNGIYDNTEEGVLVQGEATISCNDISSSNNLALSINSLGKVIVEDNRLHCPGSGSGCVVAVAACGGGVLRRNHVYATNATSTDAAISQDPSAHCSLQANVIHQQTDGASDEWHDAPRPHMPAPPSLTTLPPPSLPHTSTVTRVIVPATEGCDSSSSRLCTLL